jgi:signal transduction histidine kinase
VSGQAASTIEKARLVNDLSRTNENLKRSQAALESSNRTLESRIAERTASLQAEVKEKERAQAEMRKSKEVAESATAQKSQFLANMSHEVSLHTIHRRYPQS